MHQKSLVWRVIASALLAPVLSMSAYAAVGFDDSAATDNINTDRLIVRFKDNVSAQQANAVMARLKAEQGRQFQYVKGTADQAMVFRFDKRQSRKEWGQLQRWLHATNTIEYVEPDHIVKPMAVAPNDAYFHYQWPLTDPVGGINVLPAWDYASGLNTVVAVIDTGYRPHSDLTQNLVPGYDMISDSFVANDGNGRDADASDPGDFVLAGECGSTTTINSSWHGTHVAGTIAAATNNQTGISGVAYNAKVQPVRTLGRCGGYTSDIADSILWASGYPVAGTSSNPTPARVLNLSLGGRNSCSTTLQNAINTAVARNSVVVVAAGNNNDNTAYYAPASCNNVITVAATDPLGARAPYSNTGSAVDVAAPGGAMRTASTEGILSTLNTGTQTPGVDTYAFYQGTSMATPHVAGVAALMLSANPALTPADIERILKTTARPFSTSCTGCGTGIVDAAAAVAETVRLASVDTGTDTTEGGSTDGSTGDTQDTSTKPGKGVGKKTTSDGGTGGKGGGKGGKK